MQSLGMESLPLRFERSSSNALKIAQFLENHSAVTSVNFPGLESSPYHHISLKQFESIPTSVLSFNLKDRERCFTFLNRLEFISIATNLMDNRTLILHPASSIYSEYGTERRAAMQVPDTLIRISVGIEDIEDLLTDLTNALS